MARIIKSSSKNGEVVVKEPSKFTKFIKSIKAKHLIIAWDVIASCLLITFIVLLAVRFWPSKTNVREANSIENKVIEYTTSLKDGEEALVQEVLVEELADVDIAEVQQCFVYAYNPDVENCKDYWETDENGEFVYENEKEEIKKSTNLYETNSKIIIDLIDRITSTYGDENVWNTRLYIIDITKTTNKVEITDIGGESVNIDLSVDGISQALYFVKLRDGNISSSNIAGSTKNAKLTGFISSIQSSLYKYTYYIHTNQNDYAECDEYNLSYGDNLPICRDYYNSDVVNVYYDVDNGKKPIYNWFTTTDSEFNPVSSNNKAFEPNNDSNKKVQYQNINGNIVTEFHFYGVKK